MLAYFIKALPLTSFEIRAYGFVLKATRVFPIPTQAKTTKDDEHFANG